MSFHTKGVSYITYLMGKGPHRWIDKPVLALLSGAASLYRKVVKKKYDALMRHPERQSSLDVPVVSLGNITAGGTGKTPTACLIARWLLEEGYKVALLNRGYRSKAEAQQAVMSDGEHILLDAAHGGDEALLLARSLPGIPVIVGRKRSETGQLAIDLFKPQVLLLDDGFQHWQLARDLDIVLIDCTNPFGNGHVLPRGLLREPLEHLQRAGFFLLTKSDQVTEEEKAPIYEMLRRFNDTAPIGEAIHKPAWCTPYEKWITLARRSDDESLPKGPVITVSALGNPASFERTVTDWGYTISSTMRFGDHHQYTHRDIEAIRNCCDRYHVPVVTTEKDAVKLDPTWVMHQHIPLYVLGIEIEITTGKERLQQMLRQLLGG